MIRVTRSFVEPGSLSIYRPGDSWPRPGIEPAPGSGNACGRTA